MIILELLAIAILARYVQAATRTFKWDMSYVTAAPDGVSRPVIGVNGQWPPCPIVVSKGDQVVIEAKNDLNDGEFVTLHTHGVFQNGSNYMDGVDQVTQCGIPPGQTYVYNFNVGEQTGTYWIHSHVKGQYPNGIRAPFIILDPDTPYKYDDERILSLSDWYNETMQVLIPKFMSPENEDGAEPVPDAALLWEGQNKWTDVTPGTTVRYHVVNLGAFGFFHFWIEEHELTVIEVDGVDVEPYKTSGINVAVGQRYSILVTMKDNDSCNYAMVGSMDNDMFDHPCVNPNVTGWLRYNPNKPLPEPQLVMAYPDFEDTDLVPLKPMPVVPYDELVTITVNFTDFDSVNYAIVNNNSYSAPNVPAMLTALTTGSDATDPEVYGNTTNSFVLNHLDMVWVVINNDDDGGHPFHIHGHSFQVLYRSDEDVGHFDPSQPPPMRDNPVRRDVILVKGGGYAILAFRADNPGVWFFHCHIDWHVIQGMVAQIIEAPLEMQKRLVVPKQVTDQCQAAGIPISGPAS